MSRPGDFEAAIRCDKCDARLEVVKQEQNWETTKLGRVWKGFSLYIKPHKCRKK